MLGLFGNKENRVMINDLEPLVLKRNETILNGALRHGLKIPYSCKVGGCGTCKCRLVEGKVKEFTDKSYLLTKQEIQRNIILACQSTPRSDVVVEIEGWTDSIDDVRGSICNIEPLTHDICEVSVELERPMTYRAGQYVTVRATDTDIPARCYSFAHRSEPDGRRTISFFVRAVEGGRMSNWLIDEHHTGRAVTVTGPQGNFFLRDHDQPVVLVAGGSGLAPIVALLEQALEDGAQILRQPATLLFGVRSQRDIYYTDHITGLQSAWKNEFVFEPVLSAEPDGSDWAGKRGLVSDFVEAHSGREATGYLCGPPPMLDAAINQMIRHGMKTDSIFFDKFSDQSRAAA
ncbi:MAG: oxidoreductase [Deltaproteobacteria bacterium]|nr:MAG: oxidoreductase [Deltaproteobacteria bacterium]